MKTMSTKIIYAILAVLAALTMVLFTAFASGCTDGGDDGEFASQAGNGLLTGDEVDGSQTEENNGTTDSVDPSTDSTTDTEDLSKALIIPISSLTTSARFFGTYVDGTYMEVIAFKSGSSYRTAFNTCQVCYSTSRRAYYVQSGSNLVCQECGSKFALSQVGVNRTSKTCSPYTILSSERMDTNDSLIIPYSYLVSAKNLFKTWKA